MKRKLKGPKKKQGLRALQELLNNNGVMADSIVYVIPHKNQELMDASPLQGFTPDLQEAAALFTHISTLPKCLHELLGSNEQVLALRAAGEPYTILPIDISDLYRTFEVLKPIFVCVWSANDEIAGAVRTFLQTHSLPVLHVSQSGVENSVGPENAHRETMRNYVIDVLASQNLPLKGQKQIKTLRDALIKNRDFIAVSSELKFHDHLITIPNENALRAIGFTFTEHVPLQASDDNDSYFDALKTQTGFLSFVRHHLFAENKLLLQLSPYDLVLTAPSVLKRWRKVLRGFGSDFSPEKRRQLRSVLRQIVGRETYSFMLEKEILEKEADRLVLDEQVQTLLALNRFDLDVYAAALCIRASASFVPVIRLPTSVNNIQVELTKLENTARTAGPTPHRPYKLSKLANALSLKLAKGVPDWVIEQLKVCTAVKLLADAPLEWMSVDGFPLTLQADVSRIPTTPGNLFFEKAASIRSITLRSADFDHILVIRAFSPNDRVRKVLTATLEIFNSSFEEQHVKITYADVQNEKDLIQAFENFSGALAVFDGHGNHSSTDDIGSLRLPDGPFLAWDLRNRVRIPPIVLLGACDTHPMSASHVTTANGFLAAGAITVVGTSLPIDALTSAQFIGRLLLRIRELIPIMLREEKAPVRWSRIVSGMQRRQFMTEALQAIAGNIHIVPDKALLRELSLDVGLRIDFGRKDWLEGLIDFIAKKASLPRDRIKRLLTKEAYLTDSLLHVQLGNPEYISIQPDN